VDLEAPQVNIDDLTPWYEDYLSLELEKGGPKMSLADLKKQPGVVWVDPKGTRCEKFKDEVKLPEGS
jgi:anaerobic selenocysteine-containing dehydrogenase